MSNLKQRVDELKQLHDNICKEFEEEIFYGIYLYTKTIVETWNIKYRHDYSYPSLEEISYGSISIDNLGRVVFCNDAIDIDTYEDLHCLEDRSGHYFLFPLKEIYDCENQRDYRIKMAKVNMELNIKSVKETKEREIRKLQKELADLS